MADGVILVYQVGRAARGALKRARAQLDNVKANVMGIVLNGLKAEISPDFTYQDKYDYYYGGYGHEKRKKRTLLQKILAFFTENKIQEALKTFAEKKKSKTVAAAAEEVPVKETTRKITQEIISPPSERNKLDKKPMIKKLILILVLIFLILGILFQMGYLTLNIFSGEAPVSEKQNKKQEIKLSPKKESSANDAVKKELVSDVAQARNLSPASNGPVLKPQDPVEAKDVGIHQESPKAAIENSNSGDYAIQIASVPDPMVARTIADRFQKKGIEVTIEKVDIPGRGFFNRLFIGRFRDAQSAREFIKQKGIRDLYPDSLVKKLSLDQQKKRNL